MNAFLGRPSQAAIDYIERKRCFWFEAVEAGAKFYLEYYDNKFNLNLEISLDNKKTWSRYDGYLVTLENRGQRAYLRATDEGNEFITGSNRQYSFVFADENGNDSPLIACHGNIQCLLDKYGRRNDVPQQCYSYLFGDGPFDYSALVSAPVLPATTLADHCYYYMFYNCTSLTSAPALPATTLASSCYKSMFQGCSNLKISDTQVPGGVKFLDIPAGTSEPSNWNSYMFSGTGGTFSDDPEIGKAYYYYA